MALHLRIGSLTLVLALALSACEPSDEDDPATSPTPMSSGVPAGSRVLGIEINEPVGVSHGEAIADAQAIGADGVQLTMAWAALEPNAGQRDVSFLSFGMGFYRDAASKVLLSIPTLDTVSKLVPSDLAATPMDDPALIQRFRDLLTAVLAECGPELSYLVIGNEVDVYLGGRPQSEWDDFKIFIDAGLAHVHSIRPELQVGISITHGALPDARVNTLTSGMDVYFGTYYFIGNDFGGTPATNIPDDIDAMLAAAGTKDLILKEFGYPTGTATGGNEAGQEDFVRSLFAAWDAHADRMPYVMVSRMFDGERSDCEATAASYGFGGDEAFIQFLCTLGLRTYGDQPKPAWTEFVTQTTSRGF